MRRGDVVAVGGEDHQRITDAPQVGHAPLANAELALLQLVADEQVLDDGHDLLAAQEVKTVPPALEFEDALALAIDLVEEAGVFLPDRLLGFEVLEILGKPGTVEAAIAEVGHEMRQPGAAEEAAGDAHGVGAGIAGPVR